ncbi:MAG: hypothetical protein ACXVEF_29590 [Polyangiales bacterium]
MIRELIAKCPDVATEHVLADWCEDETRLVLASALRSPSPSVRACATSHLLATFEEGPTATAFRTALALARALGRTQWVQLAERIDQIDHDMTSSPLVFFATEMTLEGTVVDSVRWALAGELLVATPRHVGDRVVPFAQLLTRPCPKCSRPAHVVTQSRSQLDGARDNDCWIEVHDLCIEELHVERVGVSEHAWMPYGIV